jgi:hypothetical protein
MLRILAPAFAVLVAVMAVPANAEKEISPRKMIDTTCSAYRGGVTAPKLSYMTSADRARLEAEKSILGFGRMKHGDMNTYYKAVTNDKGEAPVLELYRTGKRLGNKGCVSATPAR